MTFLMLALAATAPFYTACKPKKKCPKCSGGGSGGGPGGGSGGPGDHGERGPRAIAAPAGEDDTGSGTGIAVPGVGDGTGLAVGTAGTGLDGTGTGSGTGAGTGSGSGTGIGTSETRPVGTAFHRCPSDDPALQPGELPQLARTLSEPALSRVIAETPAATLLTQLNTPQLPTGRTALTCAIESLTGKAPVDEMARSVVGKFLDAGANVNTQDFDKNSPLAYAVFYGDPALVERLLAPREGREKIKVNTKNVDGLAPIHIAVAELRAELAKPIPAADPGRQAQLDAIERRMTVLQKLVQHNPAGATTEEKTDLVLGGGPANQSPLRVLVQALPTTAGDATKNAVLIRAAELFLNEPRFDRSSVNGEDCRLLPSRLQTALGGCR